MKLRINEVAESVGLNMSQVQRRTGLTMTKLRRYWYNETKSVELDALFRLLKLFRVHDPSITLDQLFFIPETE